MRRLLLAGLAALTAGAAPAWALPAEAPAAPVLLSTTTLPASAGAAAPALVLDGSGLATGGATVSGRTVLWQRGTAGTWTRLPAAGGLLSALPQGRLGGLGVDVAGNLHRSEATGSGVTVLRTAGGGSAVDRGSALAVPAATGTPLLAVGRYTSGVEGASVTVAAATDAGPVVARSLDGGLTFAQQTPVAVLGDARPAALVVDPSDDTRVTLALVAGDDVRTSVSTDGARTFSPGLVATGPGVGLADPALAVVPGGTVLAVPTGDEVLLAAPGETQLRVVTGPLDGVALLASPGRLWLAGVGVDGAVALRRSTDLGRTWSGPLVVGSGGDGAPALSGDGSGGVLVAWATPSGVQVAQAR